MSIRHSAKRPCSVTSGLAAAVRRRWRRAGSEGEGAADGGFAGVSFVFDARGEVPRLLQHELVVAKRQRLQGRGRVRRGRA